VSLASRWLGTSFHTWAVGVPEQIDTETCHVSMVAWRSFQPVEKHMPQNMNLQTRTSKLPPIETCQVSMGSPMRVLMFG